MKSDSPGHLDMKRIYARRFRQLTRILLLRATQGPADMQEVERDADFEDKLIEEEKKYEHLYNTGSRDHKDQEMAAPSWITIAESVGRSVKDCKDKWKYLRDQYARKRKSMDAKSGAPTQKRMRWKFFESLSFLSDHIKHRIADSNIESNVSFSERENDYPSSALELEVEDSQDDEAEVVVARGRAPTPRARKEESKVDAAILRYINEVRGRSASSSSERHFANHVASTITSFRPRIQRIAKLKIQELLCELEEQNEVNELFPGVDNTGV